MICVRQQTVLLLHLGPQCDCLLHTYLVMTLGRSPMQRRVTFSVHWLHICTCLDQEAGHLRKIGLP